MGLMRFLRRQFGAPDMEPMLPPAPPPEVPSPVPEPALPTLRRPIVSAQRQGNVTQSDGSSAGQDILRFAERRDTRFAVVKEPDARREILRLQDEINHLNRQRRQLRDERDRWQRLARELEDELLTLRRAGPRGSDSPLAAADRFRRAKMVLARLTHPDSSGLTGIEASIRAKLFQEFWAEFERIEAETTARHVGGRQPDIFAQPQSRR